MKRKLSFLLVLCLCASILCNTAMADVVNADDQNIGGEVATSGSVSSGFPDVPATAPYAEAVKVLSEAGIIQGDTSGNFNPDRTVTRAQTAAVLCRMLGIEESAKVKKNTMSRKAIGPPVTLRPLRKKALSADMPMAALSLIIR